MPKLWDNYGKGSFKNKVGDYSSVAASVLTACGIPQATHDDSGGKLSGVDIKRMDALAAIKASLFETVVDNKLLEMIVDKDGNVKFIEIGKNSGNLSDIYYSSQSYAYRNDKVSVLVTGRTPLPERKIGNYTELLSGVFNVKYWEADVISSACAMPNLKRFVTITYDDPHMSSSYDDGIDNLYSVSDPFESLIGYVYDMDYGTDDPYVEITFSDKATVPIKISSLGTLAIVDPAAADYTGQHDDCLRGLGDVVSCGGGAVNIEIPDELKYDDKITGSTNKFLGVSGVYVVGYKVAIGFYPTTEEESMNVPSNNNTNLWIVPEDTTLDIIKLDEGKNYGIGYNRDEVCIKFADRSPLAMQGLCGAGKEVYIPAWSAYHDSFEQTVDLLPISETEAIVVKEIWAAIDIASPCINIFDPNGEALDIAKGMSIKIAPISMIKEPAPVALNGTLINQKDGVIDHDPTTTQDVSSDTDMDNALNSMNGGVGLSINMSCFDSGAVADFSSNLYNMYSNDAGVSTVFVCGPKDSDVEIGDNIGGGIVNSIEYRYNDKSSYTVSVQTGPKFDSKFVASVNNGKYIKKDESITLEGTIVADHGDGGYYDVMLEQLGRREAVNGTMSVLRVGDIVSVSVHNNPVEA